MNEGSNRVGQASLTRVGLVSLTRVGLVSLTRVGLASLTRVGLASRNPLQVADVPWWWWHLRGDTGDGALQHDVQPTEAR